MPAGPSGHHAIRARGERCGYRDIVCKAAHQRLGSTYIANFVASYVNGNIPSRERIAPSTPGS